MGSENTRGEFAARAGIRTNTAQKSAQQEKGRVAAPGNSEQRVRPKSVNQS